MEESAGVAPTDRPSVVSGVVSGALTVLAFTVVHDWMISDIWFSFPAMLVAGCICGGSLTWTYGELSSAPSFWSWTGFVSLELGFVLLLGIASTLVFEPVVPMAVLIEANEPPSELIVEAMPLTLTFIVGAAAAKNLLWGWAPRQIVSSLVTSTLLIVLLGLNVSVLGLVLFSGEALRPVIEFYGLIVFIMGTYWVLMLGLERRVLRH